MQSGYVYVLENEAMPNLLKIGFTSRSPEERSRELSSATGVPTVFTVKYAIFTHDMRIVENTVHSSLDKYRENKDKKFFKIDLHEAIQIIREVAEELRLKTKKSVVGINEINEKYETIELLGELKKLYPDQIKNELCSIRIFQTNLRCYLETTISKVITHYDAGQTPLVDQYIHRQDMGFISDGEDYTSDLLFKPQNTVSQNARIFLYNFDDYNKRMCCSEIFKD